MSTTPNLLTIAEAAEVMRVSTRSVWRWIESGDLKTVKLPSGRQRIEMGALREMLGDDPESEAA